MLTKNANRRELYKQAFLAADADTKNALAKTGLAIGDLVEHNGAQYILRSVRFSIRDNALTLVIDPENGKPPRILPADAVSKVG